MSAWNFDIKAAPHGRYEVKQRREGVDVRVFIPQRVILATKCGKVTISHYQPEVKRWEMLADGEMPVAWAYHQPGQKLPEYPVSESTGSGSKVPTVGSDGPSLAESEVDQISANNPHLPSGAAACSADTPAVTLLPAAGDQFESDGPKSRPGDAAASHTQIEQQPATGKASAQERSSDRSGGQFGDAPKPAHIPGTEVQP